ncbi:AAA family ATPase [Enterococcus sp. LJL120]
MIIWINGAFGAGKTTMAELLVEKLENAYLYDPENVGDFLRKNLPKELQKADFQDYPEWRQWNVQMLKKIYQEYSGDIVVPMTVHRPQIFAELIGELRQNEIPLCHLQLEVSQETVLARLQERNPELIALGS